MSREADLYKDKIEVSLDGRQIFYLFFGGAVIVGLVFVLGVMVGRRVEARGHVDRARTTAAVDPLAALDRLEDKGGLSFKGSLMGTPSTSDVENKIDALEKQRVGKHDGATKPEAKVEAKVEAKPEVKPEAKVEPKPESKVEVKPESKAKSDVKVEAKAEPKSEPKTESKSESKSESKTEKKPDAKLEAKAEPKVEKKTEDKPKAEVKPESKPAVVADKPKTEKSDKPADAIASADKPKESKESSKESRYTLQLSSFQDRAEADAFLSSLKGQGYQAHVTEASVSGKGTFYRVRMGTYKSIDAANDAKAEFEKVSKKSASVMKL